MGDEIESDVHEKIVHDWGDGRAHAAHEADIDLKGIAGKYVGVREDGNQLVGTEGTCPPGRHREPGTADVQTDWVALHKITWSHLS